MLTDSQLKLLERFYNTAKRFQFKYCLPRSSLRLRELADFNTLYQLGYIYFRGISGQLVYFPTDRGVQAVLDKGQQHLFPVEGYFYFYLDQDCTQPYLFERDGKWVHAKTTTLKAALAFKQRARNRNIFVYFQNEFKKRRPNPDESLRIAQQRYDNDPSDKDYYSEYNRLRLRTGLLPVARVFRYGEGWSAQTTLADGRVVSSATTIHDGWWGVSHLTWIDGGEDISLGEHHVSSCRGQNNRRVDFSRVPPPSREQVEKFHQQVVDHILAGGVLGYRTWQTHEEVNQLIEETLNQLET